MGAQPDVLAKDLSVFDVGFVAYYKVLDLVPKQYVNFIYELYEHKEFVNYHVALEVFLVVILLGVLFTPRKQRVQVTKGLSEKEIDMMVSEYQPQPLYTGDSSVHIEDDGASHVFTSPLHKNLVLMGGKEVLNFGSLNYLGLINNQRVSKDCVKTVQKYGVGACGPRGFYGTIDVHLALEDKIASFIGTEEAIVYSYGFATIASAIPPYSNRNDVIFCDMGVGFPTQTGLMASRSNLQWFKHNDMEHLEFLLQKLDNEDKLEPERAIHQRRLIIVEGLYVNYGDVCPLPQVIALKKKYNARLFVEESHSFGVLGKHGKGVTEHFDVSIKDVDQICASLEHSIGSVGGFCAGTTFVIDHQRLQGKGYCYSASLPPLNSQASISGIEELQDDPSLVKTLHSNAKLARKLLRSGKCRLDIAGDEFSQIIHLTLSNVFNHNTTRVFENACLQDIVDTVLQDDDIMLCRAKFIEEKEMHLPPPSIRVTITAQHTTAEITKLAKAICSAAEKILL